MKSPKNKKITARVFDYARANHRRAALLVFAVVFVAGTAWIGVGQYMNKRQTKYATVEVNPVEYGSLPAWWLSDYFGSSICEADECKHDSDPDGDKLTNGQEHYYKSNPTKSDTNGNGLSDGDDVAQNYDPSKPGKVTFEEAASDDSIVGEGLAFEEDLMNEFNEEVDISKVPLQVTPDGILNVVYDESSEIYSQYRDDLNDTVNRYFPKDGMDDLATVMETGTDLDVMIFGRKALELSMDLKKMRVPAKFLTFHKYNIALYQTIYELLSLNAAAADMSNPEGDVWFDKAQAMYALIQKLNYEKQRLLLE